MFDDDFRFDGVEGILERLQIITSHYHVCKLRCVSRNKKTMVVLCKVHP